MIRLLLLLTLPVIGCCQEIKQGEMEIRSLLQRQEDAWNAGNIEEFMEGYWKSDSLQFIGSQITHGWNATLARYQRTYPNVEAMGRLTFVFFDFKFIRADVCLVTGKYHLKRINDEPGGMFTLLLRKINGRWVIVYDHTS